MGYANPDEAELNFEPVELGADQGATQEAEGAGEG